MQSFFWIVTGFAAVQAVVLFFTMSFMSYVFGWRFTLVSFSALMYLAIQAYKYYTGLEIFRVDTRIGAIFMFFYMILLILSFVVFIARPREIYIRYLRRTVGGLKDHLDTKDRIICETEHLAAQTEDARYALAHEMHRIANAKNEEIREITIANQKKLAEAEAEKQKALKIAAKGKKQIRSMTEKEEALVMAISAIREEKDCANIEKDRAFAMNDKAIEMKDQALEMKDKALEMTKKAMVKISALEANEKKLKQQLQQITKERDHFSERTEDQVKEVKRLSQTAQRIINNVNHELRIPVSNVMNFSDMLKDALTGAENAYIKDLAIEVFRGSSRLSTMIINMLDLATLSAAKVELKKEALDLSNLIKERSVKMMEIYKENKKLNLRFNLIDLYVHADANYMRQILDNLLINAILYSKEGMIKITLNEELNNMFSCTIHDNGIGIPPLELMDVFNPFKVSSRTESDAQGRGVGLALCKAAVESHGGTIRAESDGIRGASVIFRMPIGLEEQIKIAEESKPLITSSDEKK